MYFKKRCNSMKLRSRKLRKLNRRKHKSRKIKFYRGGADDKQKMSDAQEPEEKQTNILENVTKGLQ